MTIVFALAAHGACLSPTEMVVHVTTDVDCSRIRDTSIAVGPLAGLDRALASSVSTRCDPGGNLGMLVVVPGTSSGPIGIRVVTGLDGLSADDCVRNGYVGGCIVARRALSFVSHRPLDVPVAMSGSCRDIACTPDTTCVQGACVPAAAQCTGTTCDVDAGAGPADGGGPNDAAPSDGSPNDGGPPDADASPPPWTWTKLPKQSFIAGRTGQGAVWTGSEVWLWAGQDATGNASDGLRYKPSAQSWTYLPAPPNGHAGVRPLAWSGSELLVWGGIPAESDGDRFDGGAWGSIVDPATIAATTGFKSRYGHALVWAPNAGVLVVWGGFDSATSALLADGARYNAAQNTWTPMSAGPLQQRGMPGAVYVNGKVVIYGGNCLSPCADVAVYDPVNDTWSPKFQSLARIPSVSVSDGARAIFWGPDVGATTTELLVVDPNVPAAQVVGNLGSHPSAPTPRFFSAGFAANGKLWVWGGNKSDDPSVHQPLGDGAVYDFASDTWTPMPGGGPSPRSGHSMTWTGTRAILFGGIDANGVFGDGWSFGP